MRQQRLARMLRTSIVTVAILSAVVAPRRKPRMVDFSHIEAAIANLIKRVDNLEAENVSLREKQATLEQSSTSSTDDQNKLEALATQLDGIAAEQGASGTATTGGHPATTDSTTGTSTTPTPATTAELQPVVLQ